ncbi:glutamate 5-kinase [Paraglaciecola aquimarina]|uniref:Glutamate 5-kinase n=1 Tax=Paraglaciecola algarum TaxID=3050085 RepID=A0ABS9D4N7_9ALTE|nr:glutamate 5-kinase [Paraglaciecola sp. G1-23]MCF2946972.1 glutamate 5-kinase [Paraglaciecola sp. G1-23]
MGFLNSKRIVIKIGSALIAPNKKGCSSFYLLSIAQFIIRCRMKGIEVVLVSSGSVAAGAKLFADNVSPSVAMKKAMAAAGQTEMMATWDKLFDFPTAQILLTHGDLRDRERYISIKETISCLLENGILPILNENDTVTTDNLKVGDNDNMSAMVAAAAGADSLIICSDVDGLYDKNPNTHKDAKLIPEVAEIDAYIYSIAGDATSLVGTGGMKTKIEAAEKAVSNGVHTYIVNGFSERSFNLLLEGNNPGTYFKPDETPMHEHLHWMTHTSTSQGEVVVDNDFSASLETESVQLTSDEIVSVNGDFSPGDTILVRTDDGTKLAKAKTNYGSCLLNYIAEQSDEMKLSGTFNPDGPIISEQNIAVLEN